MRRFRPLFPRDPLYPLRAVLRTVRNRKRPDFRDAAKDEAVASGQPTEKPSKRSWFATSHDIVDHCVAIILWGFVIATVIFGLHSLIVGPNTSGEGFNRCGLWVDYRARTGGLLGETLVDAVVVKPFPQNQWFDGQTFGFVFSGDLSVEVRPQPGETVWVDDEGRVVHMGRVLKVKDLTMLKTASIRTSISSPDEFLAVIDDLRAGRKALP